MTIFVKSKSAKIFETINLVNLKLHNISNTNCFFHIKGTKDTLRTYSDSIYYSLDKRESTVTIMLDIIKTFYNVKYSILIDE